MVGKIIIDGIIGSTKEQKGVELVDIISQVKSQPEATAFDVHINSKGGNFNLGFDIFAYLKSLNVPIKTIGHSVVASIATVVFMAGSVREVQANTIFMIHSPMMPSVENATADELEYYAKQVKGVESKMSLFYTEHTGLQKEAVLPMLKTETFLSKEQLFSLGFTTQAEAQAIYAIFNIDKSSKMKKDENVKAGETIVAMIKKYLSGKETVAKMVLTGDQKELDFAELEADAVVKVGDKATIEGAPAEGTIVLADGSSLVFEVGAVTEVIPKTDGDDDSEEVEALKAEVEKLKAEKVTAESKVLTAEASLKTEKTEKEKALKMIESINTIQSKIVDADAKKRKDAITLKETEVADAVAGLMDM